MGASAAPWAGAGVAAVFGDDGRDLRQFGDLVPGRRRVVRPRFGRQGVPAAAAVAGAVIDELPHAVGRQAHARGRGVPRLTAGPPTGRRLDDRLWGGRRGGPPGGRGGGGGWGGGR